MDKIDQEITPLYTTDLLVKHISQNLNDYGFEIAPFLVTWYNEIVSARLLLDKNFAPSSNCVAMCIISNPNMFENSFLPYLWEWFQTNDVRSLNDALRPLKAQYSHPLQTPSHNDPLDWSAFIRLNEALNQSIKQVCVQLSDDASSFWLSKASFIPDYAMRPVTRLPYVHMQCAGHVAGMAYFHRSQAESGGAATAGCSLHPAYGGWFGFRGIYLFPNLECPNLPRRSPHSSIPPGLPPFIPGEVENLLSEYRNNWRQNNWRDSGLSTHSRHLYSAAARDFFNTPPSKRAALLEGWFEERQSGNKIVQ